MFDYHVHVTGMPLVEKYKPYVKNELSSSLVRNNIDGFLGIISPGALYSSSEIVGFPPFYCFFDINGEGLNIVKSLGGTPAISLFPEIINQEDIIKRVSDNGITHLKLFYDGEAGIADLINSASDIGIREILIHTPSDFGRIFPVFDLVSNKGIQLILGHGCYDSIDLIKKVVDYGFLVDTSINSVDNVRFWIDNNARANLVFGSDWPCTREGVVDFKSQDREMVKYKSLFN